MQPMKGPAGGAGPADCVNPPSAPESDDELAVRVVDQHAQRVTSNLQSMGVMKHKMDEALATVGPLASRVTGSFDPEYRQAGPQAITTTISSEGLPWYKKEPVQLRSNLAGVVSAITLLVGLNISSEYASVLLDVLVVVIPIAGGWIAGLSARDKVVPVAKLDNVTEHPTSASGR